MLELGCGLGLPSLAAALGGARVLATDRSADALAFAGANAAQNGVTVQTAVCAWAEPAPLLARAPWDLVLAADVLYGQRDVDELTALLPRLVEDGARCGSPTLAARSPLRSSRRRGSGGPSSSRCPPGKPTSRSTAWWARAGRPHPPRSRARAAQVVSTAAVEVAAAARRACITQRLR